ncbi:MAG TPA: pyrroloquinoline quinone biosynthesis peptide chaperone PqqD [Trebonia sp.]|jgi:pyrroloquinoline quinone biosynthesis protein D|nr:pyrroloquinoline quinone biosynthesis peptide chaperone PqqD [Trebonia sp.]
MTDPKLAPHVRLAFDRARGKPVLLAPESVTTLNDTGAAIVRLCDGTRSAAEIAAELKREYADVDADEVGAFIDRLTRLRCLRAPSASPAGGEEDQG